MTPRLEKINLGKRQGCNHPEIIDGIWHAGKFSRQPYGLNFEAVYDTGYQLDWGGWQELYKIKAK